jgi:hypothetical protein
MKKSVLAVSFSFLLLVTVFNMCAWCAGWSSNPYEFGAVLTGSTTCKSISWSNDSGGYTACDINGCYQLPLPTRSVVFSASGVFSVSPSSATVPGYGSVNLNVCTSPTSDGDYSGTLTATFSPPYDISGNTDINTVHMKAHTTMVTAEPLGATLTFDTTQVGAYNTKFFKVCNYNASSVTISSVSVNNSNYMVTSGINSVITPNNCQPVSIAFTPQAPGTSNGTIQINTTGGNTTYPCSGYGSQNTITSSSTGNGTINPSSVSVNFNGSTSVTMSPSAGYTLNSLTDNGTVVTAAPSTSGTFIYTLSNVKSNHNIIASFIAQKIITASATDSNGTITPTSGSTIYNQSGYFTFTITPISGYTLNKILYDGSDITSSAYVSSPTTFVLNLPSNITANHTLQVSFLAGTIPYTASAVPAMSLPVIISLVAVMSGIMFWNVRKRRVN